MQQRSIVQDRIETFVGSLGIPHSQAQPLITKLGSDSNLTAFIKGKKYDASELIALACLSAQICLGADSVDTIPLNQSTVDANWSVTFTTQNNQKLISIMKVTSMPILPNMRCTPRIGTSCFQDA